MADNLTNAEEDRLLDLSLPTGAGAITMKLTSTAPTDSAAGTVLSGGAYADQTFAVGAASGGSKSNSADVLFPVATADWSTIVGIECWVSGVRRWYRALSGAEQRTILTGDQYKVAAGALTFALS